MTGRELSRRSAYLSVLLALGVLSVLAGRHGAEVIRLRGATAVTMSLGDRMPDILAYRGDGTPVDLDQQVVPLNAGEVAVLILVNNTCSKCAGEAIVWNQLRNQHGNARFATVLISASRADLRQYDHVSFPVLLADVEAARLVRASGSPAIRVYDSDRILTFQADGYDATVKLEEWLDEQRL